MNSGRSRTPAGLQTTIPHQTPTNLAANETKRVIQNILPGLRKSITSLILGFVVLGGAILFRYSLKLLFAAPQSGEPNLMVLNAVVPVQRVKAAKWAISARQKDLNSWQFLHSSISFVHF